MVNLAKKFVEDYEAGRLAYEYGIPRDEMLNEAQRLGWDEVDNGGVKARPTAQEFGRLLDTYRSAIQYGINDHIEAAGFALDEWVEHALGVTAAPAPAPLTMPEFRDTCTDPDNCRRCGHGTPTWDQANHEHAGIPIGPQKTKPKDGVASGGEARLSRLAESIEQVIPDILKTHPEHHGVLKAVARELRTRGVAPTGGNDASR